MRIKELCQRAGVSKELVRHYENLALIYYTQEIAGSRHYRRFSEDALTRLHLINIGKRLGFTLKEIKPFLGAYMGGELSRDEIYRVLEEQYQSVIQKIEEAEKMKSLLAYKMALFTADNELLPAAVIREHSKES